MDFRGNVRDAPLFTSNGVRERETEINRERKREIGRERKAKRVRAKMLEIAHVMSASR